MRSLPLTRLEPTTEAWPGDAGAPEAADAPGVKPVTPASRLRLPPAATVEETKLFLTGNYKSLNKFVFWFFIVWDQC